MQLPQFVVKSLVQISRSFCFFCLFLSIPYSCFLISGRLHLTCHSLSHSDCGSSRCRMVLRGFSMYRFDTLPLLPLRDCGHRLAVGSFCFQADHAANQAFWVMRCITTVLVTTIVLIVILAWFTFRYLIFDLFSCHLLIHDGGAWCDYCLCLCFLIFVAVRD